MIRIYNREGFNLNPNPRFFTSSFHPIDSRQTSEESTLCSCCESGKATEEPIPLRNTKQSEDALHESVFVSKHKSNDQETSPPSGPTRSVENVSHVPERCLLVKYSSLGNDHFYLEPQHPVVPFNIVPPLSTVSDNLKQTTNLERKERKIIRGGPTRKTRRQKRNHYLAFQSTARRNTILLAKSHSYQPHAIYTTRRISDNIYTAVFTLLFCCFPLGLASLYYSFQVRKYRSSGDREKTRESSILGRKLANTGIMLGVTTYAFALIYFAVRWNVPYVPFQYFPTDMDN